MAHGVGTFNCHHRLHMVMQRGAHHCAAAQRTAQHTLDLLWRTSSTSIAHLLAKAERRPPLRCGAAAGGPTPSSGISEARPRRAPACVVSLRRTHAPIHACQCDGVGEHHVADRPHDDVVTRGARAKPKRWCWRRRPHDDVVTPHRRRQRRNAGRHRAGLPAPSPNLLLGANSPQMMVLANTALQVGRTTGGASSLRRTAGSG